MQYFMKRFFELGDRYAAQSDWTDFALTKFCLCAMGVIIGTLIPKKHTKVAQGIAGGIFLTTYVVLMKKVIEIIMEMTEVEEIEEGTEGVFVIVDEDEETEETSEEE